MFSISVLAESNSWIIRRPILDGNQSCFEIFEGQNSRAIVCEHISLIRTACNSFIYVWLKAWSQAVKLLTFLIYVERCGEGNIMRRDYRPLLIFEFYFSRIEGLTTLSRTLFHIKGEKPKFGKRNTKNLETRACICFPISSYLEGYGCWGLADTRGPV